MNKSHYIFKIGKYENISDVPDKQAYEWIKTKHWDFKIFKFWLENKKEIKELITNGNDFFIHFIKELTEEEYNCFVK